MLIFVVVKLPREFIMDFTTTKNPFHVTSIHLGWKYGISLVDMLEGHALGVQDIELGPLLPIATGWFHYSGWSRQH